MASMLVFGFHPVREALRRRPHRVKHVLIARRQQAVRRREIEQLCRRHAIPIGLTTDRELSELCGGVHNGFAAELDPAPTHPAETSRDGEFVVLLEDVQDPRNLGALLRTCEAAGVGGVIIRDRGSAPLTPTVVKTAAGATEWLPIERATNTAATIERLKKEGFWVYGADPIGKPPWSLDLTGKIVLCFGGEARGLRARTRKICDDLIGLPMLGSVESLNVAAAVAAVVYEAIRQRTAVGDD